MKKKSNRAKRGYSLVELLVVSSLMLIFLAVLMISYSSSSKGSRDRRREQDIKQVQVALEQYYEVYNNYPVANSMSTLLSNASFREFLQNTQVQDPLNTGSYVYTVSSNGVTYQLSYTKEATQTLTVVSSIGH